MTKKELLGLFRRDKRISFNNLITKRPLLRNKRLFETKYSRTDQVKFVEDSL